MLDGLHAGYLNILARASARMKATLAAASKTVKADPDNNSSSSRYGDCLAYTQRVIRG